MRHMSDREPRQSESRERKCSLTSTKYVVVGADSVTHRHKLISVRDTLTSEAVRYHKRQPPQGFSGF